MNLFDLHKKPETLKGYEQRFHVPQLAYDELMARNKKVLNSHRPHPSRYEDLEPGLLQVPEYAFAYVNFVLHKRWPEAERVIMKNPFMAYLYAMNIIDGRWPEAEPTILKNSADSAMYAMDVLKRPWPEGEKVIRKASYWKREYEKHFKVKIKHEPL